MAEQQQQDPSSADNGLTISTNGSNNDETTPLLASSRMDDTKSGAEREKDENDANYISILNYARRLIYASHCVSQFR